MRQSSSFLFVSIALGVCVMLSACGRKSPHNPPRNSAAEVSENAQEDSLIYEAKYHDIPLPVGFRYEALVGSANYRKSVGSLPLQQVCTFYLQHMERDGWHILDFSTKEEGLIICQKSGRLCAISVRPLSENNQTMICLMTPEQSACASSELYDLNAKRIDGIV